jgi:N-formylglutamate deformylase
MTDTFTLHRGTAPLLVSVPHCGTALPDDVRDALGHRARAIEDADWHLDRLYAFVRDLGASFLVPRFARYAIDLNRPPDDAPMYPGASTGPRADDVLRWRAALPGGPHGRSRIARRRERGGSRTTTRWRRSSPRSARATATRCCSTVTASATASWLFEGKLPTSTSARLRGRLCIRLA